MPCVSSVNRYMEHSSYLMTLNCFHTNAFHQFGISNCNRNTVYFCRNTVSADFLYLCHTILVDFLTVGIL